jgi:hypothetical protein
MGLVTSERETWSFGLRFKPSAGPGAPFLASGFEQGDLDAMRARYSTFHNSVDARISSFAFFKECRAYEIGTDGRSTSEPLVSSQAAIGGYYSTPQFPWQNSVAVTLDAGYPAKGRFGRFYLPPQCLTIEDTGLVNVTQATALRTGVAAMLNDLSNLAGVDVGFGLAVIGRTGPAGTSRNVESVRVGRVVDTQRRRRRQVSENYITGPFTA